MKIQPLYEYYLYIRTGDPDNIERANEVAYAIFDDLDGDAWKFNFVMAAARREIAKAFA